MTAYYNEIDPYAVQYLKNLIDAGHIAPGDVDSRDIRDVRPDQLCGYDQVHLFAGLGGWSLALRTAGISDGYPIWTASCPCQPFSAAGRKGGLADERHLWPAAFHLIEHCAPERVLGEQVASPDGLAWLDLVLTDLEGAFYAPWAVDTCAAGFGSPQLRQRLYWGARRVGRSGGAGLSFCQCGSLEGSGRREARGATEQSGGSLGVVACPYCERLIEHAEPDGEQIPGREASQSGHDHARRGLSGGVASTDGGECGGQSGGEGCEPHGAAAGRIEGDGGPASDCKVGVVADAAEPRRRTRGRSSETRDGGTPPRLEPGRLCPTDGEQPGPTNGYWRSADWLRCRDDKWRPVEPGSFPLADGAPGRVGRLRTAGNAIVIPQAAEIARAFFEEEGLT